MWSLLPCESRPFVAARDDVFGRWLFAASLGADLAMLPDPPRSALLAVQYDAWNLSLSAYEALEDRILELDGRSIGRILVSRPSGVLHGVELALAEEMRGRGIGAAILRSLFAVADREERTFRIVTRSNNPARRLYERVGLEIEREDELHVWYVRHGS
jgi:ribosomal protein S18 acetylase RimI-like enzyme